MKKKAFTLVELIVVITILAILWTIAFISLSWYSKEARDSKRITDTSSLLSKINIEEVRWTNLSDLIITEADTVTLKILWEDNPNVQSFRKANFKTLKEDEKNFEDPFKKGQYYPMAYAIWWEWKDAYKFVQIATVSEKENRNIIKWNYYKLEESDDESLFKSGSTKYTEKPGSDLVYDLDWVIPKEPETPKIWCASPTPSSDWIKNTTIWNPTEVNQAWIKWAENCWFICNELYEGEDCEIYNPYKWESWIVEVPNKVWGNDIVIKDWNWDWIIIMDRNLWATEAWTCSSTPDCPEKIAWYHYQWWRNLWFKTTEKWILNPEKNPIDFSEWKTNTNFIWGQNVISNRGDWSITREDNAWWWANDTETSTDSSTIIWARQWDCPSWYHIPSVAEWEKLKNIWLWINWETCNLLNHANWWYCCQWWSTKSFEKFQQELKIPLAWIRYKEWKIFHNNWEWWAYLWSSSPKNEKWYYFDIIDWFMCYQLYEPRQLGRSIRCFKN